MTKQSGDIYSSGLAMAIWTSLMCSRDMPLVILERSNWRINCRGKNLLKRFPNDPYHGTTLRGSKMGILLIQWSLTMRRKRKAPLNPTHPVCHVAESPSAPLTQHNPSSLFCDHHPPSPICRRISLASLGSTYWGWSLRESFSIIWQLPCN